MFDQNPQSNQMKILTNNWPKK